jgi:SAM-dependent methyltransferase
MQRVVQPELLDSLPHEDPAALHSRRDLQKINRLMRTEPWFARTLAARLRPGERVLEVGAGMGELARELQAGGLQVDGLDLRPRPAGWPADRAWHEADLLQFDGYGVYDAVIAGLVLHHFTDGQLAALGERLREGPHLVCACEPARSRANQVWFRILGPSLGINHVTRHDAHVSIAAGFRGEELAGALGLRKPEWTTRVESALFGAYRMIAARNG